MKAKYILLIKFLKKHKERVALIGVGVAFLFFIGGGLYLQKDAKTEREPLPTALPVRVELTTQQNDNGGHRKQATTEKTSYFLKPSPEELLEQLASMANMNVAVVDEKIKQLPVLWPAYFFALRKTEGGPTILLLDVSEDGFGVVIESEVDPSVYPELGELAIGEKVWIGGKILAVDRTGVGRIYLSTEELRFGVDTLFPQDSPDTEK